jgi:RNA polymerase sigma-70 factor (ECF subfamily)
LGRALSELMPDEPDVHGLLALMLLNDSRRDARFVDGSLVLLADQDRSKWNAGEIAEGRAILERALALGDRGRLASGHRSGRSLSLRGPYLLQAAIASLHADDPPDWPQLAALYGELARITGSPVVELNRAAAVAETGDPEGALVIVDSLDLDAYHYLHATRAELLSRLDRPDDAEAAYERALELVHSDAERSFLERRLAAIRA